MEIEKLKKIIYGNKSVSVQNLKQFSTKLTEETTNTAVVSDLPKLLPAVFKYAVHEDKKLREAALPALIELAVLLDLNKHLKEQPWWKEMKSEILKSVEVLMDLVSTGDDQWSALWMTTVMILGSDLRSELTLLNKLLKVVEKAFKMNDEEVRHKGFECWCKLIDNFSINKHEINNKRRLGLLVIPLKANNHNTPRLCASKMKTWKHLLSKLDQHNEMTVHMLVNHFLEFMFVGVKQSSTSIAPACKTLSNECANVFSQMLQTPLLFRILPEQFIRHAFVCIEQVHRDFALSVTIWDSLLDNMKNNQWAENHVTELLTSLTKASSNDKLSKSKTFAHMVRLLYSGSHCLPSSTVVEHLQTILSVALEPHVLVNYTEAWCTELLNIVTETDPIQLPSNIVGNIIAKLNVLAESELFRDEKLKFLRGMWMKMINMMCKWMADDGRIGKNGNVETDLQNIQQLLFFGATSLSSTWNKLQMKSWKSLYSECVKYFSLSTEVKCERFVGNLVELLIEGIKDKKVPLHVALDLVSVILELHLHKDESSILPLMLEVAESTMSSFQNDTSGTSALLNQYLKIILVAARSEPTLVNDLLTVTETMLKSLEATPLADGHLDKTRNAVLKTQIQLNALKPCRSQDKSESPNVPLASSPTMTSFLHRLAKSKETKSKVGSGSPTPSQSSDVSSSPSLTPNSKKSSSPFCDMKSEDFVFVPPKPRKILLTDHQKESMTTRKHDIPALYQDLSQDSSQSAFESIVIPAKAVDKEQLERGSTLNLPKNFKEVNFRTLSPKKSPITNLTSSTVEDKLQYNKENDCVNNNKKSPIKSNSIEIKSSGGAEESTLKVLQDDVKRSQDNVSENVEISNANTRLRSRKSLSSNSSGKQSSTVEENTNTDSDSQKNCEDSGSVSIESSKDDLLHKVDKTEDRIKPNEIVKDMKVVSKDIKDNVSTPKNSSVEVTTPKRSLRKTKLNISVKKSLKKNMKGNKPEEEENENEKSNVSLSNSGGKSTDSVTTPKVSPRRLRKRKSGVTPLLTGGELIKRVRKSQSPLDLKDTSTDKSSKTSGKTETPMIIDNDRNLIKHDTVLSNVKQIDEDEKHDKTTKQSNSKHVSVKTKSLPQVEVDNIISNPTTTEENTNNPPNKSSENAAKEVPDGQSEVALENKSNEPDVVVIFEKVKVDLSSGTVENKTSLNTLDEKCKQISSKSLITATLNDSVTCIDISCSPVKVVVERLPDIIFSVNQLESQKERKTLEESVKNIDIVQKTCSPVKNLKPFLDASDLVSKDVSCKIKLPYVNIKATVNEVKSLLVPAEDTSALKVTGTCSNESEGDYDQPENDIDKVENTPSENEDSENKEFEHEKGSIVQIQMKSKDTHSWSIKTRSAEKSAISVEFPKCNEEVNSTDLLGNRKSLVNGISEDLNDLKNTPVKKPVDLELLEISCVQTTKNKETSTPSTSCNHKSSENTPVKSGQKHLKQTQLPFTPIRKPVGPESKPEAEPSEKQNSKLEVKEGKSPLQVLTKTGTSKVLSLSPKSQSKNKKNIDDERESDILKPSMNKVLDSCETHKFNDKEIDKVRADESTILSESMAETRQEIQRTPEKANTSTSLVICLERTEVEVSKKSIEESPNKISESEDIIASSQETNMPTQSILVSHRNTSSSNSFKLLSKSPKKCELTSHNNSSSDRILRSSPAKTETARFSATPVKKSVCRRLDVEIEESPEYSEVNSLPITTEEKPPTNQNSEDVSVDFKLLNGERESIKLEENDLPSSKNLEDMHDLNTDRSPRSHKNLKRFVVEPDASSVGSPKRTMGLLKFEGSSSSPISSPNSRTSQMMELAKQEQEKTISSPISSTKRRRIVPIRVGSLTRTPKSNVIQRTHSGPSEEWVRRTYSPTASPNSSILKRTQVISPDSSPPSSKKKRVSFLDPPVSQSLLFSKANPGKGQIQRPEPKPETESEEVASLDSVEVETETEEVPSQGSMGVEVQETLYPEAKVFSPLKKCSSPLTDILERIVNLQWMGELESQLTRLGVTTVGQLSSLPEETVQRLPFIPPKLERLRKILQNYYNEINEKPADTRPICSETTSEGCLSPDVLRSEIQNVSPEKMDEESTPPVGNLPSSEEDIASIAENIKCKLEQYPELISELGKKLHVDTVMKLLDFAVSKLKNENDKS